MITKQWFSGIAFVAGATVFCLAQVSVAAGFGANWLEVRVLDKQNGSAVAEAAVCVGTSANPHQFGARRSDASGAVRFEDLLSDSLVVTVSKKGYQGREQRVESLNQARVVVLKLAPGGGGPHCDAPAALAPVDVSSGLAIDGVSIRKDPGGSGRILVSVRASGPANQVRISEQPDFGGSDWQQLEQPVPYELTDAEGVRQIYVQVRRHVESQGASIEVISPVERVQYRP
ncbi:MAG: carboxypeptidase regulatory-like domain-containing protein [Gammaproteobacteria bacterium]|nr:MAG: carboxypeptidase regulatory-like domain-containing protein [Gammaproteobacteria bacterium]